MQSKNIQCRHSVAGVATNTNKAENQDSCAAFQDDTIAAVMVADGLGGGGYGVNARNSSQRVIDLLQNRIILLNGVNNGEQVEEQLTSMFLLAKENLVEFAQQQSGMGKAADALLFGTTAIVALETEHHITIAYAGNGAAWQIRGNFNEFPANYHFPWNAVNLLNPHSVPENGKEALYRLISNSEERNESLPSVIQIRKDLIEGDIIMICSDGIYSADQIRVGVNPRGTWQQCEPIMLRFFEELKSYFEKTDSHSQHTVAYFLDQFLEGVKPMLNDDASIGLLITQTALQWQAGKKRKCDENNTS